MRFFSKARSLLAYELCFAGAAFSIDYIVDKIFLNQISHK